MGKNVVDIVNDKILLELFEAKISGGVAPWRRPWIIVPKQNFKSGHKYRGINRLLLSFEPDEFYITFKQIKEMKASLKKDSKSRMVVYWNIMEKKSPDGSINKIPFLKYFNVFKSSDVDGLPTKEVEGEIKNNTREDIEPFISNLIATKGLKIENVGNESDYDYVNDVVRIPKIERFDNTLYYYQTLFRELSKWTGKKDRLNRERPKEGKDFLKWKVKEELTAEMASAYLCEHFGIDLIPDTITYLEEWTNKIKEDRFLVTSAAGKAEKVLEFFGV